MASEDRKEKDVRCINFVNSLFCEEGRIEILWKYISLKKVATYFFNVEKENECFFFLKKRDISEIPGTLTNLVLSPHAAEKN